MNNPEAKLLLRLLFLLRRGLIEARLLVQGQRLQQLYDLTDTLEPLPAAISQWSEDELAATRFNLTSYEAKYPENTFQYSRYLDLTSPEPPPF